MPKHSLSFIKQEQINQAVLICDTSYNGFPAIGRSINPSLIPFLDRPLIDYTLNSLKLSGIHEVFVFCCLHSDQVRQFIKQNWSKKQCQMNVVVHSSSDYLSLGDILRDLFAKAVIRTDFILIHSDTITNIQFSDLLEQHKKTKEADKGCIMTVLFQLCNIDRTRKRSEQYVTLYNTKNKLLSYEKLLPKKIDINKNVFHENRKISVRCDLQDTNICICSPIVASLFADNFDYQTIEDFITGIICQEEILGYSIYIKIINRNYYAGRVSTPASYKAVCRDMIERWTFPIVPDIEDNHNYKRHHIYVKNSSIFMHSKLNRNIIIGDNTVIGNDVELNDCVIGANCNIGDNVKIDGSYIWDGSKIEKDCELKSCIIGRNVHIKKSTIINTGCLISSNVCIGPDIALKEYTFIDSKGDAEVDFNLVGKEGNGFIWKHEQENDNELSPSDYWDKNCKEIDDDELFLSSSETDEEDNEYEENMYVNMDDEIRMFYNEVIDSLQRGIDDKIKCENLILEVNSSKHAYNVPIAEVNSLVIRAIVDIIYKSKGSQEMKSYFKWIETTIDHFLPLIQNYIKTLDAQKDCLLSLEEFSLSNNDNNAIFFTKIINILYEKDVIYEDIILKWYNSPQALVSFLENNEYEKSTQCTWRKQKSLMSFIQWLQEAEEESEEE